jgi:tetratricopeptide (TPR) repeat protein
VRELEPELEQWLPLLAIPFGVDLPPTPEVAELAPGFRRARLHAVTLRFLRARLPRPALVEVEDAHQMDAASADLLTALAAELDAVPWLVVTVRRDARGGFTAPEGDHVVRLTPRALPPEAALTLAEAATDSAPVPPHRLRMAVERSGGNPQLLRDLLRSVGAGEETLPDSIETAALARVDRLAPAERTLVRRAAVLGVAFHPRHLADVLDRGVPPPDADTWDRLSDVITDMGEGYLRFRRSVVRDAAYAALPFAQRRRLHAAVAARLATERSTSLDELAPALSLHYSRAGDAPEAWTYARLAAGHAAQRLAFADAAVLLRRALEAARTVTVSPQRLAETWEALADALAHTGELADAHAALRAARHHVRDDPVRTAELLLAHARIADRAGNVPAAVRWGRRALRLVEGKHEPAAIACRAQTHSMLAGMRQREGRTREAIALCRRVIADAHGGREADPGLAASLAHAWFILDWALYDAGRPEEATHSEGALEIYERLNDLDRQAAVLNNLGGFAYHEGRWHDAVALYERAAEASERAGDTANAAFGACNVGEVLSDQGRLEEAGRQLRRALRIWRGSEYDWGTAFATTLLGRAAVRSGRHAEGLDLLEQGLSGFQRLRALPDAALAEAYTAEGLAFAGRPEAALLAADRALRDATRTVPLLHRVRGFALAQLGDRDGAAHALHASLNEAEERGNAYELAVTLDALEALGGAGAGSAARCAALLEQLGVEGLPAPPLRSASRDRRRAAGQR